MSPIPSLNDAPSYTTLTETWTKDGASTQQAVTNYLLQTNQNPRKITITAPKRVKQEFNIPTMLLINGMTGLSIRTKPGTETPVTLYCRAAPLHGRKEVILLRDRLRLLRQTNFSRRRKDFSYGGYYNQVTSERDYDFDGSMLREVRTQYQNDRYEAPSTITFSIFPQLSKLTREMARPGSPERTSLTIKMRKIWPIRRM